jgi:hypothetical protein
VPDDDELVVKLWVPAWRCTRVALAGETPMMCVKLDPDRAIEFAEGLLRAVRGES